MLFSEKKRKKNWLARVFLLLKHCQHFEFKKAHALGETNRFELASSEMRMLLDVYFAHERTNLCNKALCVVLCASFCGEKRKR